MRGPLLGNDPKLYPSEEERMLFDLKLHMCSPCLTNSSTPKSGRFIDYITIDIRYLLHQNLFQEENPIQNHQPIGWKDDPAPDEEEPAVVSRFLLGP